ncbi:MAG: phytanoyl-CoA dioxygenase family protein [Pseudomonadales bacterium]
MIRTTGWGIIGCGDVADRKAGAAFNAIPGSRLVAVMRRNGDAARAFAERHGATHWGTDAAAVIDHPDVTAVYVATPPAHHLEYALAVAAAGKPCLVEKPAGRSLAEFVRMRDAFRSAGVPLYVSYYRRHLPRFRKVKEIIDSGVLGRLVSVDYRMSKPPRSEGWSSDVSMSGGGPFYDLAGHMLDLFDDWFGPLQLTGASATNAIPRDPFEHAVALSFRGADGVIGNALWDFAASEAGDSLIIDGVRGRISMQGTAVDKPVQVAFARAAQTRLAGSRVQRWLNKQRDKLGLAGAESYRFPRVERPHQPMLAALVDALGQGVAADNADAALRTATLVDQALTPYYGGRADAFWEHPERWQSLQADASRRNQQPLPEAYQLTQADVEMFEQDGYAGPFRCDGHWQQLLVPVKKGRNYHLEEADLFELCTHPSIVRRIAQLMGRSRLSLFKSRYVVKLPETEETEVPWHQDVGNRNGGFTRDGKAVPTLSVFLAIDEMDLGNGGLEVIPGSHRTLIGNYNKQIRSELIETGALSDAELARAKPVVLKPGEFIIFHSWLLHGSAPNQSERRRAALNIRFAPRGLECEDEFVYIPLRTGDVPPSDRVFDNEVWHGRGNDADLPALAEAG